MMDPSWRLRRPPPPSPLFPHLYPYDRPPFPRPPTPQFPYNDPRFAPPPLPHPYHTRSFREDPIERDVLYKRMRMDDGAFGPELGAPSLEDERRLNLIRDHGRQHPNGEQYPYDWNRSDPGFVSPFRGVRDAWRPQGGVQEGNYRPQQFKKFGREENVEPTRVGFDSFDDRRYHTMGGGEFRYGQAQRSSREWDTSNYEDHESRWCAEERGSVKDNPFYGDPWEFASKGFATLPCKRPPCFENDRFPEPPLQNYAANVQEFPDHRENGVLPSENPSERNATRCGYARESFGSCLPLERFSSPSLDARVPLPMPLGYNVVGGSAPEKAFSSANFPPPLPLLVSSPLREPPALYHRPPIFPVVPSSATPPQGDPVANAPAPPPPPPPPEAMPNGQAYLQAFPSNIGVSSFAMDTSTLLSTHVLQTPISEFRQEECPFPLKQPIVEKPVIVDASHIFRKPHRANRPDHFVIILRGLPGSGKSYVAKLLRDIEVEEGGNVPRIHSMDDYFMTEVEKNEDADGEKSSSSFRGKKQATKTVMQYCYEPEMEEAYRASMLKAFKRTLEEGTFTFVIVDDRNLRVADFAQFWAIGKRSGYEVYLLEAKYKDPMGCAARNVHGFTSDDIQKLAEKWEEAPPLYMQLDTQSLFHVDGLDSHDIQEVDMDMEDEVTYDEKDVPKMQEVSDVDKEENVSVAYDSPEVSHSWDAEDDSFKDLGRSKWSEDLDFDDVGKNNSKEQLGALSGLVQTYSKPAKSVSWADQGGRRGFEIGSSKSLSNLSLIIGPGSGYNLSSNPLPDEEASADTNGKSKESKRHSLFLEHLRAERESFRLVFDRRRQRIGISDADDE